jgi:MarR-like DNA-binding transcriptional regulator SgrR of sgrS sRNA
MSNNELRVAFIKYQPASSYDPLKIYFAPDYAFLENIYSPLIENDAAGDLVSGVAESFDWVGTEAHFKIRPNLKTVDGEPIDARDVEASFKRALIMDGGTHTDLKNALCPDVKLSKLSDVCPDIKVLKNNSVIVLKLKEKKDSFFKMLTSIDLAIIPRNSIDPQTLAITNYRNTSGPYYVAQDDNGGYIKLMANPNHYHYSEKMAKTIQMIPAGKNGQMESLNLFEANKLDFITTCDKVQPETMIPYVKEHEADARLHLTAPFKLHMLAFTKKGMTRFTDAERFAIAKGLKRIYLIHALTVPGTESAKQMVPQFGDGMLSAEQTALLNSASSVASDKEVFTKNLYAWNLSMGHLFADDAVELKKYFPNLRIEISKKVPAFTDFKKEGIEEPDLMFLTIDMGFQESMGRMAYLTNAGIFYSPNMDEKKWLSQYMRLPDAAHRISASRNLHFDTLVHACAMPMAWSPYAAMVRKPWKFNLSKVTPNNQLWRIYHD